MAILGIQSLSVPPMDTQKPDGSQNARSIVLSAIGGEIVEVILAGLQVSEVRVTEASAKNTSSWKIIKREDLPSELRMARPLNRLEAILAASRLKISQYDNGDKRLELFLGLKGGMLGRRRDVVNHIRRAEGHAQLVNAIDRNLGAIRPAGVSALTRVAIEGGAVAVGATAGAVVIGGIALGIAILCAANPLGLAVLAAGAAGGVGAGAVCWFFAHAYVKNDREEAAIVDNQIQQLISDFYEIQLLISESSKRRDRGDRVREAIRNLTERMVSESYLLHCDQYTCTLNEAKFKKIAKFYSNDHQTEAVFEIKFIVICILAALPAGERPLDSITQLLVELIDNTGETALKNYAYVVLGRLYLDRLSYRESLDCFGRVPRDSDLYVYAQDWINQIQDYMRSLE